jgi:hypothetical protein
VGGVVMKYGFDIGLMDLHEIFLFSRSKVKVTGSNV